MKKIYYISSIIICIFFAFFFVHVFDKQKEISYEQAYSARKKFVEYTAIEVKKSIDLDGDWITAHNFYENFLIWSSELLDREPYTFCEVTDKNFTVLSKRNYDEDNEYLQWNPFNYNEFLQIVSNNHSGELSLPYGDGHIKLFFIWIPDEDAEYLMITGVIPEAADVIGVEFSIGAALLILSVVILHFVLIYNINKQICKT